MTLPRWLALGAGLACMSPWFVWQVVFPPPLELTAYSDSVAKAKGLAAFAKDHGDEFGRIRLIAKIGSSFKQLALDDIQTRERVLGIV